MPRREHRANRDATEQEVHHASDASKPRGLHDRLSNARSPCRAGAAFRCDLVYAHVGRLVLPHSKSPIRVLQPPAPIERPCSPRRAPRTCLEMLRDAVPCSDPSARRSTIMSSVPEKAASRRRGVLEDACGKVRLLHMIVTA